MSVVFLHHTYEYQMAYGYPANKLSSSPLLISKLPNQRVFTTAFQL